MYGKLCSEVYELLNVRFSLRELKSTQRVETPTKAEHFTQSTIAVATLNVVRKHTCPGCPKSISNNPVSVQMPNLVNISRTVAKLS